MKPANSVGHRANGHKTPGRYGVAPMKFKKTKPLWQMPTELLYSGETCLAGGLCSGKTPRSRKKLPHGARESCPFSRGARTAYSCSVTNSAVPLCFACRATHVATPACDGATCLSIRRQYAGLHLVQCLGITIATHRAEGIVGTVAVVAVHAAHVPWRHQAPA